ncbi:MAG: hypothetical protein NC489_27775 [Ruminococcus flavefaciens]|nr:hypothetical protein [Ruminococcus flavefaciens]
MMKMRRKLVVMVSILVVMVFCCAGCSGDSSGIEAGTYKGSSEGEKGVISSTFVFGEDGTCSYEYVYEANYAEHKVSYTGVWMESEEKDTYEIALNEMSSTLYAKVLDSGNVIVSSDGNGWQTETFTKE